MVYSETRGSRPWLHPVAPFGGWRSAGSQVLTGRNKPCAVSAWDFAHFRQQRYGECGLQAADLRINDRGRGNPSDHCVPALRPVNGYLRTDAQRQRPRRREIVPVGQLNLLLQGLLRYRLSPTERGLSDTL